MCLAVGFLSYRPSGGIYFPVAAVFVACGGGGNIRLSMAIVCAITVLFGAEWCLLYLDQSNGTLFPLFVAVEIVLSGIGVTFVFRQTRELQRRDKASERERIAKDMRDVLGHSLSSLALKAELARRIFPTDPGRALQEISDIEHIARQGLEEMRNAISGYYSGDICAELDRVAALLKAADVSVERRWEQLDMPPAYERVLALIVREAVTNILRHSHAKACRLALFRASGAYRLDLSDNGRGGSLEEGIGIRSRRTRAEARGGTAVWSSDVGTPAVGDLAGVSPRRISLSVQRSPGCPRGGPTNGARRSRSAAVTSRTDIDVVAQASDGTEALAMVRTHEPDVLITDVEMPRASGLEVARQLQGQSRTMVIVLTNFASWLEGYLRRALSRRVVDGAIIWGAFCQWLVEQHCAGAASWDAWSLILSWPPSHGAAAPIRFHSRQRESPTSWRLKVLARQISPRGWGFLPGLSATICQRRF